MRESPESHPLYRPLKQRCLVLVDEEGRALDSTKPMRTEGRPDLAIVYTIGESAQDPNVGAENCMQFMEWATELLQFRDSTRRFTGVEPYLFSDDFPPNSIVLKIPDPLHAHKLEAARKGSFALKPHVGLAFARLQVPQVRDEVYENFCPIEKLPQPGTPARAILDRVTLMKNLDLALFGDRNADHILYTGGDLPMPHAYNRMEALATNYGGEIEIIGPYKLVYGLKTGALVRGTSSLREERFSNLDNYIRACRNWEGYVGRNSYSLDVFYFKSRT